MRLSIKPVEKLGRDIFAIDFSKSKKLGIELYAENPKSLITSPVALSLDGDLYINKKSKNYQIFKNFYILLDGATTENIIKLYKVYDGKYPHDNTLEDIEKYADAEAKGGAICKILIKYELLRREYKTSKSQSLLNSLFH